ncbi:hypothetical protein D3C86_1201200 [compost metagenome]
MRAVHDDDVQFVEAVADAVSLSPVLFGASGGALLQQSLDLGLERRITALEPLVRRQGQHAEQAGGFGQAPAGHGDVVDVGLGVVQQVAQGVSEPEQLGDGARRVQVVLQRVQHRVHRILGQFHLGLVQRGLVEVGQGRVGVAQDAVEAVQVLAALLQQGLVPVERLTIVGAQQGPAHHLARHGLHQIVQQQDVADRLGHLLGVHGQEAVVHPVAGVFVVRLIAMRVAVGADALGDLVLMVREDQVDAAAVDVDGQAQRLLDHGRAFDVPAGTPRAPRRRPGRLVRLGRLPQDEVVRILLVGRDLDAGAGDHVVQIAPRQRAVGRIGRDVEQDMTLGGIGAAGVDDGLDLGRDGVDVVGDVRGDVGRADVQQAHVGQIGGLIPRRDLADRHAFLRGLGVDLVVHVGDVAGVDDLVRAIGPAQQAHQDVEHHRRAGVADMGVVIDRGAADIERHPVRIARLESALFTAKGVVDMQRHG